MTTGYIVAVDHDEYWTPIAVTAHKDVAEEIQQKCRSHLFDRILEKWNETHDVADGDLPFDDEQARRAANDMVVIASQKPPHLGALFSRTEVEEVFKWLDDDVDESEMLEYWPEMP